MYSTTAATVSVSGNVSPTITRKNPIARLMVKPIDTCKAKAYPMLSHNYIPFGHTNDSHRDKKETP